MRLSRVRFPYQQPYEGCQKPVERPTPNADGLPIVSTRLLQEKTRGSRRLLVACERVSIREDGTSQTRHATPCRAKAFPVLSGCTGTLYTHKKEKPMLGFKRFTVKKNERGLVAAQRRLRARAAAWPVTGWPQR